MYFSTLVLSGTGVYLFDVDLYECQRLARNFLFLCHSGCLIGSCVDRVFCDETVYWGSLNRRGDVGADEYVILSGRDRRVETRMYHDVFSTGLG